MANARRVALVTGAAKRVGRAIVEKLAGEGFEIAFTYNKSAGQAEALSESLQARGAKVLAIEADLTQPANAVEQIARECIEHSMADVNVLVNSASIYEQTEFEDLQNEQHARRLMAIHFESPFRLAQVFGPALRQSRGHIINMVDLLAERPWPEFMAYCASKAALANLTLSLARELAPEVTVNGIAPGVVEWPPDYPQSEREKYLKRVPLNRAGTPQDVANLVHFLATGGSYITGQIIRLDGGRSIT